MKKKFYSERVGVAALFTLSIFFQYHLIPCHDVSWHLEAAKRLLAGGTYRKNIFDDNLPMVFWYFIPVVWLHHITGIFLMTLATAETYLVILASFLLCHDYLKLIYSNSSWSRYTISVVMLASFLFFPQYEFGQRDTLVAILSFPYIFLIAATLQNNTLRISTWRTIITGLFAATALAMNPFYGLVILALEIQHKIAKQKFWRPELITLFISVLIYYISIMILYPDYFTKIIPSFLVFSPGFASPVSALLISNPAIRCYWAIIVFAAVFFIAEHRAWLLTILLSVITTFFVFLIHRKLWLSHTVFLLYTLNIFFCAVILEILRNQSSKNRMVRYAIFCVCLCVLSSTVLQAYTISSTQYRLDHDPHYRLQKFIALFQTFPKNSTLYLLASTPGPTLLAAQYTQQQFLSPWPSCWMMPVIVSNTQHPILTGWKMHWANKYQKIISQKITRNLLAEKPDYIIIDVRKHLNYTRFNYLHWVQKNAALKTFWKKYFFIKKIVGFKIFKRQSG